MTWACLYAFALTWWVKYRPPTLHEIVAVAEHVNPRNEPPE